MMPGDTIGASAEARRLRGHVLLLMDAGYVATVGKGTFRLTSLGHDYIAAIRDESIWQKTMANVRESGGNATLEIIKRIANRLLEQQLEKYLGNGS